MFTTIHLTWRHLQTYVGMSILRIKETLNTFFLLDPCNWVQCGQNAECTLEEKGPKCKCKPGCTGNPNHGCQGRVLLNENKRIVYFIQLFFAQISTNALPCFPLIQMALVVLVQFALTFSVASSANVCLVVWVTRTKKDALALQSVPQIKTVHWTLPVNNTRAFALPPALRSSVVRTPTASHSTTLAFVSVSLDTQEAALI